MIKADKKTIETNAQANDKTALFETMPVGKALLMMAIPTIVSQLITMIYNLADTFFIGMTNDPYKVAAASVVSILFFILTALSNQPWYFVHNGENIRVYCVVQGFIKKWMSAMNRIDMGIAISHLKLKNTAFKFEIEKAPADLKGYSYIGTVTL